MKGYQTIHTNSSAKVANYALLSSIYHNVNIFNTECANIIEISFPILLCADALYFVAYTHSVAAKLMKRIKALVDKSMKLSKHYVHLQ